MLISNISSYASPDRFVVGLTRNARASGFLGGRDSVPLQSTHEVHGSVG
jgi:hypothetical protein